MNISVLSRNVGFEESWVVTHSVSGSRNCALVRSGRKGVAPALFCGIVSAATLSLYKTTGRDAK
jgi:hypothetical protein